MPRFVRPVFLSASATDRNNVPGSTRTVSPRDRSGGIDAVLTIRDAGTVAPCLSIHAIGSRDGYTVSARVNVERAGVLVSPDGKRTDVAVGSVLQFVNVAQ